MIQREEGEEKTLRQIPLTESRIEASGPSKPFVSQGQLPTWFAVGTREIPTNVEEESGREHAAPAAISLEQNYPNPFNSTTTISYHLQTVATTTLRTYDLTGQLISIQHAGHQPPGHYQIRWSAQDSDSEELASGIYIYRLTTLSPDGQIQSKSKKMTLVR